MTSQTPGPDYDAGDDYAVERHCGNVLIHVKHIWETSIPVLDEDENETDAWVHVGALCEGNDDQDDPMDRYECCEHCGSSRCPRRDGHVDPCRTQDCQQGHELLGEHTPFSPGNGGAS